MLWNCLALLAAVQVPVPVDDDVFEVFYGKNSTGAPQLDALKKANHQPDRVLVAVQEGAKHGHVTVLVPGADPKPGEDLKFRVYDGNVLGGLRDLEKGQPIVNPDLQRQLDKFLTNEYGTPEQYQRLVSDSSAPKVTIESLAASRGITKDQALQQVIGDYQKNGNSWTLSFDPANLYPEKGAPKVHVYSVSADPDSVARLAAGYKPGTGFEDPSRQKTRCNDLYQQLLGDHLPPGRAMANDIAAYLRGMSGLPKVPLLRNDFSIIAAKHGAYIPGEDGTSRSAEDWERASRLAELINSGKYDKEKLLEAMRGLKDPLRQQGQLLQQAIAALQGRRDEFDKEWAKISKEANEGYLDLIGMSLKGLSRVLGDVELPAGEFLLLGGWRKAAEDLTAAMQTGILAGKPVDKEKILKLTLSLMDTVVNSAEGQKLLGKAAFLGPYFSLTVSILGSGQTIFNELMAIEKFNGIESDAERLRFAQEWLDKNAKDLVESLRQLGALSDIVDLLGAGKISAADILAVLNGLTLENLDKTGALPPPSLPTEFSSSELHQKQEPMGEVTYFNGAQVSSRLGGESAYFYQLQGRRTGSGRGSARNIMAGSGPARGAYSQARTTRGPVYSAADNSANNLQRVYNQERVMRQASVYGSWASGGKMSTRPCSACGGKGKIDLSSRLGPLMQQAQSMLSSAQQQLGSTRVCPGGKHNHGYCIQAENYRRQAMQQAAQARSMMSKMSMTYPCSGCGGKGVMGSR